MVFGVVATSLGITAANRGWLAVVLGALVMTAAVTVLLLQRRLLNAPIPAGDESQLVVNDVILAIGLNDLVAGAFMTTVFAGYVAVLVLGSYWYLIPYVAAVFLVSRLVFYRKTGPHRTPVAHRFAAATR
jgi:small-conductance mechanosensitive channel